MDADYRVLQFSLSHTLRIVAREFPKARREDVEDSVSFTKEQFFYKTSFAMFDSQKQLLQWCIKVSKNYLLRLFSEGIRYTPLDSVPIEKMGSYIDIEYENSQYLDYLINQLPVNQKIVIEKVLQGSKLPEIAQDMDLKYDTVKRRWERAIQRMIIYNDK